MLMIRSASTIVVPILLGLSSASAQEPRASAIEPARALFERYVALEQQFDSGVADLYSDDAVIQNKRTYPTGQVREMTIPTAHYKELLRKSMPLAKVLGDKSTYSACSYDPEGAKVRIKCQRFSERKKYTSPISLLVGPAANGKWLIFEELSESQP